MFFLLPVGVDYRARRHPVVTFTLMGICVVVWLVQAVLSAAKGVVVDEWVIFLWFRIWNGEFFLPAWLVISFWFLKDLALMLLMRAASEVGGGVAFAAHVGGTLFGLGLVSLEKLRLKHLPEEEEEGVEEAAPITPARRPIARVRVRPAVVPVMSEVPTIYLFVNEAQAGPFTLSHIQQMLATGAISSDAMYWQQGMENWQVVEELRQPGVT